MGLLTDSSAYRQHLLQAIREALIGTHPQLAEQLSQPGGLGTIGMHLNRLVALTEQQAARGSTVTRRDIDREICPRCIFHPPGESCELRRSNNGCMLRQHMNTVLQAIADVMLVRSQG